jgi:hypothetical protein
MTLPQETIEKIIIDAAKRYPCSPEGIPFMAGHVAGATEWAGKAHQERQERVHLQKENDIITGNFSALQAKCDRYEAALKEARKMIQQNYEVKAIMCINEALSAGEGDKLGLPHLTEPILNDEDLKAWEQKQKEDKQ